VFTRSFGARWAPFVRDPGVRRASAKDVLLEWFTNTNRRHRNGGRGGAVSPLTGTIWNSGAREKKGHNLEIRLGDEVGDTLGCTHRKRYFVIFALYDIYFGKTIHLAALHIWVMRLIWRLNLQVRRPSSVERVCLLEADQKLPFLLPHLQRRVIFEQTRTNTRGT